jgi:aspartyl-tRNA(Asn)/glutamyl-tRNA(Gln) amidotransferase subunit A
VHPEVAAAVDAAVRRLQDLGAHVEAVDPGFDDPLEITTGLWFSGAWTVWNSLTRGAAGGGRPRFRRRGHLGSAISALELQRWPCAAARWARTCASS